MLGALKAGMVSGVKQSSLVRALQSRLTEFFGGPQLSEVYGGPRLMEPDPLPRNVTPMSPLGYILSHAGHVFRSGYMFSREDVQNPDLKDVEDQLYDLKTRLIVLGAAKPAEITAHQMMNNAQLDLKCFPLLNNHDLTECINSYINVVDSIKARDCYYQLLVAMVMGDFCELSTCPEELVRILWQINKFQDIHITYLEYAVDSYVEICNKYCPSCSEDSKNEVLEKLENDRDDDLCSVYVQLLEAPLFKHTFPRVK